MQPAFQRERIRAYASTMVEQAAETIAGWSDGQERDIHRKMMRLTFALVEANLLLATIAQQFRLHLVPGQPVAVHDGGGRLRAIRLR